MSPETIEKAEFPPALRGYDKQQVRAYLQRLGREHAKLQQNLLEAQAKITQLSVAQPQAAATIAPPEAPPTGPDESNAVSGFNTDQFDQFGLQIAGLLRDARDSASQTKSQADLESLALLEQARSESEQQLTAAQAEADRIILAANSQTEKADLEAKSMIEAAQAEASLINSTVDAEIAERQQQCEIETKERYDAAEKILADKQAEADELWNSAEAEAYKVREASRAESIEIQRTAEQDRADAVAAIESETETIRMVCDDEIALLRQQAAEDVERIRVDNEAECKELLTKADQTLADNQNQATEILAHANGEAERLMTDAFAEVDRIRLDGETSVMQLRSEADQQIGAKHEEADAYVSTMTKEGDDYVEARRTEADSFYEKRHQEAEEYVAARQGEVFKDAEEAQEARDQAFVEISDARGQVAELLEQARAQSEFIRQEAEEVIRSKVRANIDQAERRISRLRVTEQASRDRIMAAQKELQTAIVRLDNEPMAELGDSTSDSVIGEARERALESGQIFDTEAGISAISDADYGSGSATPLVAGPDDSVHEKDDVDIDLASSDGSNINAETFGLDQTTELTEDGENGPGLDLAEPAPPNAKTRIDAVITADQPGLSTKPPMPPPPSATPTMAPPKLRGAALETSGKTALEEQSTVTNPLKEVDHVLSEPAIEPQDEDALSRLVQEAMKRAVESAKGGSESRN